MPVLNQPLSLNPLKVMAKVDEIDYYAYNYIRKWMTLINFSEMGKYLMTC